jgi:hypothetical protein
MKNKIIIISLSSLLLITSYFAFAKENVESGNKPIAVYQEGNAKITIWENTRADGITWKSFQVEKIYQKEGEWKTTNSFNQYELLDLQIILDRAINEHIQKED